MIREGSQRKYRTRQSDRVSFEPGPHSRMAKHCATIVIRPIQREPRAQDRPALSRSARKEPVVSLDSLARRSKFDELSQSTLSSCRDSPLEATSFRLTQELRAEHQDTLGQAGGLMNSTSGLSSDGHTERSPS